MADGLFDQALAVFAGALYAHDGYQRGFASDFVFVHIFSGLGAGAFDVKQIVGDLESEAHVEGVGT